MTAANSKTRGPDLEGVPLAQRADLLLDRALEHGALPASTQSLLALTRRDDAEIGPVVDALALNPGLAAAVLRVANSATYGQARAIGDLKRAVTVIGMQEIHDIVAGTAMMAAFSSPDPLSERIQGTAVLSATVAQKLAAKLKAGSPNAAYLSGLMCELGALACLALDPGFSDLYGTGDSSARQRFDGEASRYGGTTPDIGGRILAASSLPTDVTQAVATTGLEPGEHTYTLGRVVAFSRLAALVLLRASEHGNAETLRNELIDAAATVGLENVDPEVLTQTCLVAAAAAELTLRGELGLSQTAPMNDVEAPAPTASSTAVKKGWWARLRG
ncbi:MAG: putative signal transduction protein [Myxococcaceae bacterium]|nr:putative signal transduction protein [Myxococcaceae bacterium]